MDNAPRCPACRQIYSQRTPPELPPCETCRIELLAENRDAAHIYMACQRQVITAGMGEVIDLNHLALWQMIDRLNVADPLRCFELINKTFHHYLRQSRDKG